MDTITNFIEININMYLLLLIVLGGIFITKYTKNFTRINDTYKVLIASIVFSIIFYFINECEENCLPQYLFTYLFATSFYEVILKAVIKKVNSTIGTDKK